MAIQIPRLRKFCCCLSIRTGALIVGYTSIVCSLFFIVEVPISLSRFISHVHDFENDPAPDLSPEETKITIQKTYFRAAYLLILSVYHLIICIVLLVGIHKDIRILRKIYLHCAFYSLVSALTAILVCMFFFKFAPVGLFEWGFILSACFIVARSAHLELEENNAPPPPGDFQRF